MGLLLVLDGRVLSETVVELGRLGGCGVSKLLKKLMTRVYLREELHSRFCRTAEFSLTWESS